MTGAVEWAADNARGRAHADMLVLAMRETGAPMILGRFVEGMKRETHDLNAFHVGFFHRIAELAMRLDA